MTISVKHVLSFMGALTLAWAAWVFLSPQSLLAHQQTSGKVSGQTTYEAVVAGMRCKQNRMGSLECDYRVGRSLHYGIVGPGEEDASIYFYSASFEGDYFTVLGLSHGCVMVRPGLAAGSARAADLAFVSPRNGKVYRSWETCRDGV